MNRAKRRGARPDQAIHSIFPCSDAASDLPGASREINQRWPPAAYQQQDVPADPHRLDGWSHRGLGVTFPVRPSSAGHGGIRSHRALLHRRINVGMG